MFTSTTPEIPEGVMINLSFSDLGHDWNTWVPEHLLEENETSGELSSL